MSEPFVKVLKSVNNKRIAQEIAQFVEEGIINFGVTWESDIQRQAFVEIVEDTMESYVEDGTIEQYKVICDLRNNKIADMERGIYKFDVTYKQKNCVNTTKILWTIDVNAEIKIEEVDFVI